MQEGLALTLIGAIPGVLVALGILAVQHTVQRMLPSLQRTGNQTLIMVTHDPQLAALADGFGWSSYGERMNERKGISSDQVCCSRRSPCNRLPLIRIIHLFAALALIVNTSGTSRPLASDVLPGRSSPVTGCSPLFIATFSCGFLRGDRLWPIRLFIMFV